MSKTTELDLTRLGQMPKKKEPSAAVFTTVIGFLIGAVSFALIFWSLFAGITER